MRSRSLLAPLAGLVLVVACSSSSSNTPSPTPADDAGVAQDGATPPADGAVADVGADAPASAPIEWKSGTRLRANDDAPCATHMTPAAALDPATGALHLLWLDGRDGRGAAVWTRCDPGAPRCAPNERVSDAPFASFALVRQSPRWLAAWTDRKSVV